MGVTLLDYEAFETLKLKLSSINISGLDSFMSAVLGYGFAGVESGSPEFILLCSPQSEAQVSALVAAQLPDGVLLLDSIQLPVRISAAVSQQELQHSVQLAEAPENPAVSPEDQLGDWVQISLGQTLRQAVLQDQRKVILPAYLLRYTPFTSPNLILLRAALSQIHFLHQSGALGEDEFDRRTVTARMHEIQRWSSFSRTSIYRLLHEDPRSRWLVRVENRGAFQNDQGQQISLPNQYFLEPLKLTPGDATDLESYLRENKANWDSLDACLLDLPRTERREILTYPYRTPQAGDRPEPATVLDILQSVFGSFELTATRLTLIDKVRDHLIGSDFVAAPWYLLRRLLPEYGASIVVAYLMCQPLLFKHNGVERDTFWLPGGAETLVSWTNDRSFGKYFPKASAKGRGRPASGGGSADAAWRKNKREMLADFFLRVQTRRDPEGMPQWQIKVWDLPILPEDARLMDSVHRRLAELIRNDQLDNLLALLDKISPENGSAAGRAVLDRVYQLPATPETRQVLACVAAGLFSDFETPEDPQISDFETPAERLISLFETPESELISKNATPVMAFISDLETHLKILEKIKDSIKMIKNSNSSPDSESSAKSTAQPAAEDWDLEKVLEPVTPRIRKEILNDPEKTVLFKAWLIHSALNSRVNQPLNLALNQAVQCLTPPESAALRLAKTALPALAAQLESKLSPAENWGSAQNSGQRKSQRDLDLLLVGEKPQVQPLLVRRLLDLIAGGEG